MELGMSGLAMPFFIYRTVACLVRTPSNCGGLPRLCPSLSQGTSAYISLLLTCGGHGSTILPGPERLLTNDLFLIVMTHVV